MLPEPPSFGTITFRFFYYRHRHLEKYFIVWGSGGCTMRTVLHNSAETFFCAAIWDILKRIPLRGIVRSAPVAIPSFLFPLLHCRTFYYADPICKSACYTQGSGERCRLLLRLRQSRSKPRTQQSIHSRCINRIAIAHMPRTLVKRKYMNSTFIANSIRRISS